MDTASKDQVLERHVSGLQVTVGGDGVDLSIHLAVAVRANRGTKCYTVQSHLHFACMLQAREMVLHEPRTPFMHTPAHCQM